MTIENMLEDSLVTGCVQIVKTIHIDDASQVQSNVWKSASVIDIQTRLGCFYVTAILS